MIFMVENRQIISIIGNGVSATSSGTCLNYSTSASTILAANSSRNYALLRNVSSGTIYLGLGRTPSTINFDTFLNQYDSLKIDSSGLFTGYIQGIGSASGTISILQW